MVLCSQPIAIQEDADVTASKLPDDAFDNEAYEALDNNLVNQLEDVLDKNVDTPHEDIDISVSDWGHCTGGRNGIVMDISRNCWTFREIVVAAF